MKFNKKDKLSLLMIIILSILSVIFTSYNDSFYKKEIMKITNMEEKETYTSRNSLGFLEKYSIKKIEGIITNGKNKGTTKVVEYEESYSSVVTDKLKIGDKVFVESNYINGLKRDTYIVFLVSVLITLLFLLGKYRGLVTAFNVGINTLIFYLSLELYFKGGNLLLICMIETIFFTSISLLIASGKNKKTLSAIISTLVSTGLLLLITIIVIKMTNYSGTNFNEMSFLTVPFEDVFIAELLIGSLGAIMDVAITCSSSIAELIEKDKKITKQALKKSGKEIGKDIMGTMINVLFFTYLCSGLPIFILALRNGYGLFQYISTNFSLELTRFLVGSIGIVMTIPIALYISIRILKGGKE